MEKTRIYLGSTDNVMRFIETIEDKDAILYFENGNLKVSAKSVLGVMSMPIDEPMNLIISGTPDQIREVNQSISRYVCTTKGA